MKPKILLLAEEDSVKGGIQSSIRRHIRLLEKDFEILLVSFENTHRESDWYGRVQKNAISGGAVHYHIQAADFASDNRLSEKASIENIRQDLRFRSYADHLIEIIKAEKPALLHAFGMFHQRGMIAAYASSKTGVPYMLSFRGVDLETRVFDRALASLEVPIRSARAVVCVSEDSERTVRTLFSPACPLRVVPNHFAPWQFKDTVTPPLPPGDGPVLGCFGSFRRVMGLDFLLEAFAELNAESPHRLLLVGSIQKRERDFYERLLQDHPYTHRIIRLGNVPQESILNYMSLCDVAVFPSVSDASPNKVLEALAAGVPVVSTTAGGIPELVEDGKHALLTAPRSTIGLTKAVRRILRDPALAAKLVEQGKARVFKELTPEKERTRWLAVYQESLV